MNFQIKSRLVRGTKFLAKALGILIIVLAVIGILGYAWWKEVWLPEDIKFVQRNLPEQNVEAGINALPEDGGKPERLGGRETGPNKSVRSVRRVFVKLDKDIDKNSLANQVPPSLIFAILMREDRGFYQHTGVSLLSILRAAEANREAGEIVQGGSTIDQQIIRNLMLGTEKTYSRKITEARLALALNWLYKNKDEILTYYLNTIYLGQHGGMEIRGVGQASWVYFHRDVRDLTLRQAAILAQMINNPAKYAPYERNAAIVLKRSNQVLKDMLEFQSGSSTAMMKLKAKSEIAKLGEKVLKSTSLETSIAKDVDEEAPYAINAVYSDVSKDYPELTSSEISLLTIQSTIDKDLQYAAHTVVQSWLPKIDRMVKKGVTANIAIVALDPRTGEVLTLIGGRNFKQNQFNRATEAKRQVGSTFKPFVFATSLQNKPDLFNWNSLFHESRPAGGWPKNFGGYCDCDRTFADTLKVSSNVITVHIGQQAGIGPVADFAEKAGLPHPREDAPSLIGASEATPVELAGAYGSFVTGKYIEPHFYRSATRPDNSKLWPKYRSWQAMSPQVAFIMTQMMRRVLEPGGTGAVVRSMGFTAPAAGKTGSSRDAWFAGYTPNLVVIVYVGIDDGTNIGLTGGRVAAPIWADFMKTALKIRPYRGGDFPETVNGVVRIQEGLDKAGKPVYSYYLSGTEPKVSESQSVATPTPTPLPEQKPENELPATRPRVVGEKP